MFNKKLREEVERLKWKVQSADDKILSLKNDLDKAIQIIRSQMVEIRDGLPISDEALLKGLPYDVISGEQLDAYCERNPDAIIVDVRTEPETRSGMIKRAKHIPVDQIYYRVDELGQNRQAPIIAYCSSGSRSEIALETLAENGFRALKNLTGGLSAYSGALETPEPPLASKSNNNKRPLEDMEPEERNLGEKVNSIIESQVNPAVASHGGFIELVDVKKRDVYLLMGGGCQGCGMAAATLRQGVEEMLRKEIPDLGQVLDSTNHSAGQNPFYSP